MFKKRSTKELLGNIESTEFSEASSKSTKKKKEKKTHEKEPFSFKRLFQNRAMLATICITIAFVLAFVLMPIVQRFASQSVDVVTVMSNVKPGDILTEDNVTLSTVGGFNVAADALHSTEEAIGKYVKVEMLEGDIVQVKKIATNMVTDDTYLLNLPSGKLAMSIGVADIASGLSGKLRAGDVIRVFSLADNSATGAAQPITPSELQYIEVLAVTNDSVQDIENGVQIEPEADADRKKISTITVAVDSTQALALTALDGKAHIALVYRGDNTQKEQMLKIQDEYIKGIGVAE